MKRSTALLALVLAFGCKVKPRLDGSECQFDSDCRSAVCVDKVCQSRDNGAKCTYAEQCHSLSCFDRTCRDKGKLGIPCHGDEHCEAGLVCARDACTTPERAAALAREAASFAAEQQRVAEAEKEARLLVESGVVVDGGVPVEAPVHPAGPGKRIRVATARAARTSFAACRSDERLVSGGCRIAVDANYDLQASYPSGHSESDTVGARWNCAATVEIQAYALCEKLAP